MKKGPVIFGSLLLLIFVALSIIVAIAVSNAPSHFVSPTGEREWARAEFDSLFVTPTSPLPLLPTDPPIVRKMTKKKNKVEFVFDEISRERWEITGFGKRVDSAPGVTSVKLPDGNTLRFLGVATYFPDKIYERHANGKTNLVWHDPGTMEPLDDSTITKLKLERSTRVDLSEQKLVLAFDLLDPELPHRWQSISTRNADTLCRIHSSSSSQTREKNHYFTLDLNAYHQSAVMLLISLFHGKPETQAIDLATLPPNKPVVFASGNVQFMIPFKSDGNQNSTKFGGVTPRSKSKIGFGWDEKSSSYQKSFAIIDCWPAVQSRQIEWRLTNPSDSKNGYWRGNFSDEGLSSLDFTTKLAKTGPLEFRLLPEVTHVAFRLDSIPGLPVVKNLFEAKSGPIHFEYRSDARRFLAAATQSQVNWHGKVWPDSSLPIEFVNITPSEIIAQAEALNGIQLHVDPETYQITEWKPKPLLERLNDWFKSLF